MPNEEITTEEINAQQLKKYIAEEAVDSRYYGRYFGVLFDAHIPHMLIRLSRKLDL